MDGVQRLNIGPTILRVVGLHRDKAKFSSKGDLQPDLVGKGPRKHTNKITKNIALLCSYFKPVAKKVLDR